MNSTGIEWCDFSWNPVTGCPGPKVSAGCAHCYAERNAKRFRGRFGYDADDPFGIHVHNDRWLQPLRRREPSRIFVCSMGDLFHKSVSDQYIAKAFAVAAMCPQHTFMFLTKRPARMLDFVSDRTTLANDRRGLAYQELAREAGRNANMDGLPWPLPNVWLGITICNQAEADELLEPLNYQYGWNYFLSCEPMLGSITLEPRHGLGGCMGSAIKWIICGGETGTGARPMEATWVRSLRDQCQDHRVPFLFKSWGAFSPVELEHTESGAVNMTGGHYHYLFDPTSNGLMRRLGKKHRVLDGREWNEVPA